MSEYFVPSLFTLQDWLAFAGIEALKVGLIVAFIVAAHRVDVHLCKGMSLAWAIGATVGLFLLWTAPFPGSHKATGIVLMIASDYAVAAALLITGCRTGMVSAYSRVVCSSPFARLDSDNPYQSPSNY